ncbi:hypothetical protein TNIN_390221 [Trichonephila inaurata madagascariensis]|uniref:Uncharacterized protein n=1 Tax=Trichonephila inaurata madagascariensis TaxID=2747483 RepID=A0A8X7C1T9_9ARAC|nr:hypothetical protein TNIN_390221 [Trichonephila inaurata madagascariensis]
MFSHYERFKTNTATKVHFNKPINTRVSESLIPHLLKRLTPEIQGQKRHGPRTNIVPFYLIHDANIYHSRWKPEACSNGSDEIWNHHSLRQPGKVFGKLLIIHSSMSRYSLLPFMIRSKNATRKTSKYGAGRAYF